MIFSQILFNYFYLLFICLFCRGYKSEKMPTVARAQRLVVAMKKGPLAERTTSWKDHRDNIKVSDPVVKDL